MERVFSADKMDICSYILHTNRQFKLEWYFAKCQVGVPYPANMTRSLSEVVESHFHTPPALVCGQFDGCDARGNRRLHRLYLPFTLQIEANHSCSVNESVALCCRHLNTRDHAITNDDYIMAERALSRLIERYPPIELQTYSLEQVVATKKASKRKAYRNALATLKRRTLRRRDRMIHMFVKYERMDVRDPPKPPRAIQARGMTFNILLQTYIIPYSKYQTRSFDPDYRFMTKGMNQYEMAGFLRTCWDRFADPVADLIDHTAYDSKTYTPWLAAEQCYFSKHFPNDTLLVDLHSTIMKSKCTTAHGIKYSVEGSVCSGDVTTSDGNSTGNECLLLDYVGDVKAYCPDNGDDSVVVFDYKDSAKVSHDKLKQYGYESKVKRVYDFEHLEYCQCRPVNTVNGWLMVRDPLRVMSRATVCLEYYHDYRSWFATVGECEESANQGVPILQSFARFMKRATDKRVKLSSEDEYKRINFKGKDIITDTARISFCAAFQITPTDQINLERYFDGLVWPTEWQHVSQATPPILAIPYQPI